jgi:hypothetical protein
MHKVKPGGQTGKRDFLPPSLCNTAPPACPVKDKDASAPVWPADSVDIPLGELVLPENDEADRLK